MKRLALIVSLVVLNSFSSFGQGPDLIIKKGGERIFCKIGITSVHTAISYCPKDSPEGGIAMPAGRQAGLWYNR